MQIKLLKVFLVVLFSSNLLIGQTFKDSPYSERQSFGLFGGFGLNLHTGGFSGLPGVPSCCPEFTTGSGFGPNFGLFYTMPIATGWEFTLRLAFTNLDGHFEDTESEYFAASSTDVNGAGVNGEFTHHLDAKLNTLGLQALAAYRLTDQMRLFGGLRLGTFISNEFSQREEITSPNYGVFRENGQRVRNNVSGEINELASLDAALMAGISYDFPLNSDYTLFLVPEASLAIGLTSIAGNTGWTANTFAGGIGLRYAPREVVPPKPKPTPPPPPPPPPLPPPPPPPVKPTLNAVIDAVSVDDNEVEKDVSEIIVEEFLINKTHPLLPYVFFGEGSSEVLSKYSRISDEAKKDYSFKQFDKLKTMDVYYQILNIVGRRMQFYPQATLEVTGCNSDEGKEQGNMDLSRSRAQAVKNFLVKEWSIDPSRIQIKNRNLPDIPSNKSVNDGIAENRRAELRSNLTQIFEPLIIRDTLRSSNPPHIRFKPNIKAQMGIKNWKIVTSQRGKNLRIFEGTGQPPAKLDWKLTQEEEQEFVPRMDIPLEYKMVVMDNDGKVWESPIQQLGVSQLTIEKKLIEEIDDKEIDRFSMIGFPFAKAEVVDINLDIAKSAKNRIRRNSEILISGYSDRMGDEEYNLNLSRRRAIEVAKTLGVSQDRVRAIGESQLLYDNDTPEGRFYSRTVTIEIVTPIE